MKSPSIAIRQGRGCRHAIALAAAVAAAVFAAGAVQSSRAEPVRAAVRLAQGDPGSGGQAGQGGFKHPESGATSPSGSGAVGPGAGNSQKRDATPAGQEGRGTIAPGNSGVKGKGKSSGGKCDNNANGSAANGDKGPGHRKPDTKPAR